MFTCPNCQGVIERQQQADGIHWVCHTCGGCTVNLSVLRRSRSAEFISDLWTKVRNGDGVFGRPCPACNKPMLTVQVNGEALDTCKVCQFVWFDPGEFELTPLLPPPKPKVEEKELPQAAKEMLAMYEVKRLAEEAGPEPADDWKMIPAVLGLPVERDDDLNEHRAWATWGLCLAVFICSALAFSNLDEIVSELGLVPDKFWRWGGVTAITSFFLHGSWWHLISNLYFLFVFGDNVENRVGWRRMLILVFTATISGNLLHALAEPRSGLPCIGASGGISGVLAFYALAFAERKISILWHYQFRGFRWIEMSAWTAFGLWFMLQLFSTVQQLTGLGHVSALAHMGGVIAGGVLWFVWKPSLPKTKSEECPIGEELNRS